MKTAYLAAILYLTANGAMAQQTNATPKPPPPPPCSADEYRQLDFWVGEWDLWYSQGKDKPKGTAHNSITKGDFGNCVITEHFTMSGFNGTSISTYHNRIGQWRQTWVDDKGGYFDLVGGPAEKGAGYDFGLELVHPEGIKVPYLRMIWQIEDKDHLVWRWQNHKKGETEWQDSWVLHYVREGAKRNELKD